MTSPIETNNVVERRLKWARSNTYQGIIYERGKPREDEWVSLRVADFDFLQARSQSLSDRIDVQNALLDRARWLMRPYCGADEALRIFCDDVAASLTQGGKT